MIDINSNIVQLLTSGMKKKEPKHEEFTAALGEIEFNDFFHKDVDLELRGLKAPNSVRFWIVVEGDTAQFYSFHNLNRCFPADVQMQEVRQWVRDVIQREYGKARVTIV